MIQRPHGGPYRRNTGGFLRLRSRTFGLSAPQFPVIARCVVACLVQSAYHRGGEALPGMVRGHGGSFS
jgi:hypothetical protein